MKKLPRFGRHPVREHFLQKGMLALSVALWLFRLPIIVRIYSIPGLLERLTRSARSDKKQTALELKEAVPIATRICHLRLFGARVFPRACLRQSLTLYRALTRMGYPVEIHLGVRKDGDDLLGHSWVTIEGKTVADGTQTYLFKAIYSYPSVSRHSSSRETSQLLQACLSTRGGHHGREETPAVSTT
jgi:Transglutaminase-like superfamily